MNVAAIQSCTACKSSVRPRFLFEKQCDDREGGAISVYQCASCGNVYLGRYSESYEGGLYAYYEKYTGRAKEEIFDSLTRASYMRVLQLLDRHGGGEAILDVGCGKGDFVEAAVGAGRSAEGIELSGQAVEIARSFGLPVKERDFFSHEILESSWDVVTMFEVIEHLPDPAAFLRRAEEVLSPGGLLYLTTPNYGSLDRRVLGVAWNAIHREHLSYFTPKTLSGLIRNTTGLDVLYVETRNISAELIAHVRGRLSMSAEKDSRNGDIPMLSGSRPADLRATIGASPSLRLIKHGINALLNATSLGSTIVMLLRKPT